MVMKIGHRGAMGYEPENTLRSFQKALDLGVDMIELDVHLCKSGELVVIHDNNTARTTNANYRVSKSNLDDLKSLDAGKGEKIPELREVLDLIARKAKVNIELKGSGTAEPVVKIIEHYVKNHGWSYDDFLVSSFSHYELRRVCDLNLEIRIGMLFDRVSKSFIRKAEIIDAYSVNLPIYSVTQDIVSRAKDHGFKVLVWTVNDPEHIEKIKSYAVDGIISDFPDRI